MFLFFRPGENEGFLHQYFRIRVYFAKCFSFHRLPADVLITCFSDLHYITVSRIELTS